MSGWRPALRIAWRETRRHRGRTVLVAALVALPVLVGAFLDVAIRTAELPAAESVRRYMGSTADAYVQVAACVPITRIGYHDHRPFANSGCDQERTDGVDLAALLPPGSTWIETDLGGEASRLSHGERSLRTLLVQLDTASPLAEGLLRLRDGRFPRAPGEIALTTEAASALHAGPGDVVTSRRIGQVIVVGIVIEPACLSCESAYGLPGWFPEAQAGSSDGEAGPAVAVGPGLKRLYGSYGSFLVDVPDSVDPFRLQRDLLAHGVILAPRAEALDPPPLDSGTGVDPMGLAIAGLVIGFGLIEVCLLAGTAFAVGARRQVRDLGLVAAAGGEARHVRRIVLAQGLVTGLVGALVAVPLVIAVVYLSRPWLERVNGALMGPLDVRPIELLPLVGLGVLAGLAAAMVPAFTAGRLPVLDALNRRFRSTSLAARWPRIGLILFIAGTGLAALGSLLWRRAEQDFQRAIDGFSVQLTDRTVQVGSGATAAPSTTPYVALLLVAFALAALGLALLAPTLVATVARAARRLPLSARMGLRDAGRHRHRTGPAVAAIMGAVAGSVALAFWAVADDDYRDRTYAWQLPEGWVQVGLYTSREDLAPGAIGDIHRIAPELLPVHDVVQVTSAVAPRPGRSTGNGPAYAPAWAQPVAGGCPTPAGSGSNGMVGVADSATLALVFGERVPDAAERALAEGRAVATDCALIGNGAIAFIHEGMYTDVVSKSDLPDPITMPAVLAERPRYFGIPSILLPPASLGRLGLTAVPGQPIIATTRTPTKSEERAFADVLADRYPEADVWVQVERGYQSDNALVLAVLTGACAFITLVGTAIAVALSAAEARSDHATLLAVGADPRRRRALAMAQAATVSLLGVGLGVVLGGIVGATMLGADIERPLLLPVGTLSQIVIGIPLLGVLIAGLCTRSRLPMVRRIE